MESPTDQGRYNVVEVMMSTVLGILRNLIEQGSASDTHDAETRDAIALMAHVWPVLSTASANVARLDDSYAAMIYYERIRLELVQKKYFLDGAPPRLVIMGAPIKLEMPAQQMADLLWEDIIEDRKTTIDKIEGMPPDSARRKKLSDTLDGLPDVATSVPLPARLFLSRLRSMCQGLRGAQPAVRFKQCQNNRCCRLFYRGEKLGGKFYMGPSYHSNLNECSDYWNLCVPLPEYDGSDDFRFCTEQCARQWQREFFDLMPDKVVWAKDDGLRERESHTDARVVTAFERSLERNSELARTIRKRRKRVSRHGSAVCRADMNREFDARVDMANIDSGLLYAASIFARLPCRRDSLTLPGERRDWRKYAADKHRNGLLRVAQIYRQHPEQRPVHELLECPSFLRAVRSSVTTIF